MAETDELRRRMTGLRSALAPEEVDRLSRQIVERFAGWLAARPGDSPTESVLALYRVIEPNRDGEVDPSPLPERAELAACTFGYARVLNRFEHLMDFAVPAHPSDWTRGVYGIPEPRYELPALKPESIDFFVVPGVVFGSRGERIGRGKGYYDRALQTAPGALRIGFAYDFQVLEEPIPQSPWDARMDVIVTERRIIEIAGRVFS